MKDEEKAAMAERLKKQTDRYDKSAYNAGVQYAQKEAAFEQFDALEVFLERMDREGNDGWGLEELCAALGRGEDHRFDPWLDSLRDQLCNRSDRYVRSFAEGALSAWLAVKNHV